MWLMLNLESLGISSTLNDLKRRVEGKLKSNAKGQEQSKHL